MILETGRIAATLLFIVVAASMYSRMRGISGLPNELGSLMESIHVGMWGTIAIYVIIVLILASIIDSTSIMLKSGHCRSRPRWGSRCYS